jgi:hypothetical protein
MDDWSLLPRRAAARAPAPDPQSPMSTTTPPARLTRPRQAPTTSANHPRPPTRALDPTGLDWQIGNQSGAEPQNPSQIGRYRLTTLRARTQTSTTLNRPLDTSRPFMDDTGRLSSRSSKQLRPQQTAALSQSDSSVS